MRPSIVKSLALWPAFPALVLMILAFGLNAFLNPNLLSNGGMIGFASTTLPLIAASLGQAILLIGRGLDLSMGATISFINVFAVTLFGLEYSTPMVIALTLGLSLAVGVLNALLVVFVRINALLATFAVSFITGGLALWLLPAPGGLIPGELVTFAMDNTASVPNGVIAILIVVVAWMLLKKTSFMLRLYAIGGDPLKAYHSGIPVSRVRAASYILSSLLAGISGLALTFSIGSGDPLIGQSYTLLSISAAVIGGVAIFGGSGDGLGAVFGAVFLAVIPELLLGLGVSSFYQQFVLGVIMVAGLAGIVLMQKQFLKLRAREAEMLRAIVAGRNA
jgi:ribose transport system permease protein